jgi:hypothetical protein
MATYLIFQQTPTTWLANQSGVGVTGVAVVVANNSSLIGKYVLLAKPRLSALTAGTLLATSTTATFTPDIIGTYQVGLFKSTETVFDPARAYAVLDFIVPTAAGNYLPAYRSTPQTFRPTPADSDLADYTSQLMQYPEPSTGLGFSPRIVPPAAATFTAQGGNGGGSLLADASGGGALRLTTTKAASAETNNAGFYRSKSGTKILTVCARVVMTDMGGVGSTLGSFGLYFGEATGRMKVLHLYGGALPNNVSLVSYNGPTSSVGGVALVTVQSGNLYWLQFQDDGLNLVGRWSTNGKDWNIAGGEARGTYLTTTPGGNRMGLFSSPFAASVQAEILSYAET